MPDTPEPRPWEESLAEFRAKAEALPPGEAKQQMEDKVRSLERAIELRDSLSEDIKVHKQHRES